MTQYENYLDMDGDAYDNRFSDPEYYKEEKVVLQMMQYHKFEQMNILDIGSGTAMFLDHTNHPTTRYQGVEPSVNLINRACKKGYKDYTFANMTFENYVRTYGHQRVFNLVISLFGSPSYIKPEYMDNIKEYGDKYFIMFLAPTYYPQTHSLMAKPPTIYRQNLDALEPEFAFRFNNYIIATNLY